MKNNQEPLELLATIIDSIQEKKGENIVHMDLRELENVPTEHFIICHGNSTTQVDAIMGEVEKQVFEKMGERCSHKEGYGNSEWIILDFFNIVVHIFYRDKREFYKLEELWSDAKIQLIENSSNEQ